MVTHPFDPDDDFPFDGPSETPRSAAPPDPPDPPEAPHREGAGPRPGDEPGGADWERVREAAWRVGQRVRRHERVLHTRISQELAGELRRAADDLRVPVSNLVRNVLEEAFGAVERVSDEVGGFLEEVPRRRRGRPRRPAPAAPPGPPLRAPGPAARAAGARRGGGVRGRRLRRGGRARGAGRRGVGRARGGAGRRGARAAHARGPCRDGPPGGRRARSGLPPAARSFPSPRCSAGSRCS